MDDCISYIPGCLEWEEAWRGGLSLSHFHPFLFLRFLPPMSMLTYPLFLSFLGLGCVEIGNRIGICALALASALISVSECFSLLVLVHRFLYRISEYHIFIVLLQGGTEGAYVGRKGKGGASKLMPAYCKYWFFGVGVGVIGSKLVRGPCTLG